MFYILFYAYPPTLCCVAGITCWTYPVASVRRARSSGTSHCAVSWDGSSSLPSCLAASSHLARSFQCTSCSPLSFHFFRALNVCLFPFSVLFPLCCLLILFLVLYCFVVVVVVCWVVGFFGGRRVVLGFDFCFEFGPLRWQPWKGRSLLVKMIGHNRRFNCFTHAGLVHQ